MVSAIKWLHIFLIASLVVAVRTGRAEDLSKGGYILKPFSKDFQRLAEAMVGTWKGKKVDDEGEMDIEVQYRLTSGNSALVERLFKDSPHEMISIYHTLRFEFVDGTNMASEKETHMRSLTVKFLDRDRMQHEWDLYADGKKQKTVTLTLHRVK